MCILSGLFKAKIDSLDQLVKHCTDITTTAQWIRQHVLYVRDIDNQKVKDYWQSPEETFASRSGDCEDMAVLAAYLLKAHKYRAHVIAASTSTKAHAVCAALSMQGWWIVSNGNLQKVNEQFLDNVPNYIYQDWVSAKEYSLEGALLRRILKRVK